jgi:hypothetical protein
MSDVSWKPDTLVFSRHTGVMQISGKPYSTLGGGKVAVGSRRSARAAVNPAVRAITVQVEIRKAVDFAAYPMSSSEIQGMDFDICVETCCQYTPEFVSAVCTG